ncbi:sensor histidine kinase [Kitasatospora acidiphila]|uniref:histidine kinase n=1 Tax=Kitasatospora acidiphila TaxID=2567942 RepID=A0A540VWJ8_9ACTN|nr:histidine kinase [Kitasatospora acidiphila]TQF01135.1 sensor histidine kinase [Kitasatospora acidiphila]
MDEVHMVGPERAHRRPGCRWLQSTLLQDAALALAITLAEVFFFGVPLVPGTSWQQQLELVAFAVPEVIALAFRRRWPIPVFAVVLAAAIGADLLTVRTDFAFTPYFGLLLALYTVARQSHRPAALAALVLAFVPAGLDSWDTYSKQAAPGYQTPALIANIAFYLPITVAAWGVGRWTRAAAAAAEHDQRELARARQAVATERVQIARELHDIVANAVAVIVMQAETARSTAPAEPARLTDTLAGIEDLGRSAMAELRRMLRLLRTADAPVEEAAGRRGLGDLEPLLEDARRAGILIDLDVQGTPAHLDDSVDLTAYRLVQEAVTNIIKHAGSGSHAAVRITWSEVLSLEVVDDGAGRSSQVRRELSTGHGLLGLAERIALFGGELTASPYRSGFRVTATLPLAPARTAS